ncbi:hypothetical protein B0A55_02324, partial [Friedmanniomyces simplex]
NAHRKGIADGGESGKTWYGALAYCKAIRPKIIIFENVQSADWASMLKHYRAIDYDCEGVFVDSKDYYIPHTRQRGYMVCFDTRGLGEKSSSSVGLGKRWQELMEKLKRRASSSVSDFLLPADQVVVRQHTRDDEAVREVDWAQCEIRQMQYRQSQGLGIARPVTHWLESGFMIVPERGLRAWFTRQVERVKDTIDCCILRTAVKSMYDPRYKTCIWDLSQNIERVHDASRGITGCILPTGIFFVSDANRILAAEETLMLQGIPLDRISFTTETQAELLDFAGNAMTSTVVGSALLAALIVGHELIDPNTSLSRVTLPGSERNTPASIAQPSADTAETFTYRAGAGAGAGELDVKEILVALERSLSGTYRYLPKCGKAADSLYCKIDEEQSNNERPIFLFWDPRPVGDSEEDVFVFSYNKSHLEKDEVRSILAHVEAPWRPWPTKGKAVAPKIMTDGTWVAAPEFQLQAQDVNLMMQRSLSATTEYDQCDQAKHILGCHVQQQAEGIKMTAGVIDVTKDVAFISGHIWLFEVMQRQIDLNVWHALPSDAVSGACLACAPPKPQLQWKLNTDRKSLKAYEDVSTANEYERAVKSRAEPIVVTAAADDHSYTVDFGVNVMSLAHRAAARLPSGSHGVAARWKLDTSNGLGVLASPKFKLLDTSGQPSDVQLGMNVELFPNQRLVLAWMQKQELGVEFFVEEAEEAVAKAIGWRAEVRVSAPLNVRGGICADHPGFGKTITSLALIQAQYLGADVSDRLTARRDKNAPGLLVSSATLIVCPATLTQQWLNEIKDKIGSISGVLTVFKIADLARYSITDFQKAKIILVNRSILGSEPYAEKLAVLAAVPGPAVKTGGRAFAQWLRYATQRVPEHLRVLQDAGRDALKQHIRTKYRERVESAQAGSGAASVPSRRLRGKDYVAAKGKQTGSKAQADRAAPATVDTKEVDRPLFEMFYFNRLIVDEFHQYDSREFAAITALKADKRWGLSGTPALDDLYDVAQLASMVGVPLRSGIDAKGVMKARNIKALRADMTDFERFEAMRSLPSSAMHARLCEVHQLFLDTFVRRNLMDFAEMRYEDNLRPVTLDLDHRVMYTELSQHLNSLDMRIKRGKKAQATDRDERLYRAVNTSETAEEALSKTAAFLDRDTFEASSGLEAAIHIREAQVTDTKKKLRRAITEAEQGESDNLQKWKWTCLENGSLQDEETIASIDGLPKLPRDLAGASKGKRKRSNESDEGLDEVEGPTKPTGANPLTSQVNTLSKRLVVAYRSLRYLHSVQRLQQHVTEHQARLPRCQAMNCDTLTPSVDLAVSAYCGHIVCKDCYKSLDEIHSTQCSAKGCCCSMQSYHLLWTSKIGDLRSINPTPYGTKLMKVVSILREIRRKDEQAVLFVQYAEQMREVERALEGQGVPSLLITDAGKAAAQIKSFQENTRYTALVLNASDETAAGLNLQNANHVIFVSPLLRDSQYTYEATMAQAIGRVRRHGQKKQVFVHRVVALDTIDVDILEHRERRTDAITEPAAPSFTFPAPRTAGVQLEANGKPKRERCQLVKVEGRYSMQPHSWLCDGEGADGEARVKGRSRVSGWEDFSSQLKFSRAYTEDDE